MHCNFLFAKIMQWSKLNQWPKTFSLIFFFQNFLSKSGGINYVIKYSFSGHSDSKSIKTEARHSRRCKAGPAAEKVDIASASDEEPMWDGCRPWWEHL
jgi:hypothetical protein